MKLLIRLKKLSSDRLLCNSEIILLRDVKTTFKYRKKSL